MQVAFYRGLSTALISAGAAAAAPAPAAGQVTDTIEAQPGRACESTSQTSPLHMLHGPLRTWRMTHVLTHVATAKLAEHLQLQRCTDDAMLMKLPLRGKRPGGTLPAAAVNQTGCSDQRQPAPHLPQSKVSPRSSGQGFDLR